MASKTSQINFSGQGKLLLPELGRDFHRRTGTFRLGGGGGGGGDLIARKKLHNARKNVLCKRTQIAVKQKRSQFLRLMNVLSFQNPNFSNLRGKRKLVRKIGYFEKSGVTKITVSEEGERNDFCFELSGGSKK